MVKFFSICLVVLLLCSCHSRRKEIARIVEEWKNKEVIFPDPLLVKVQGRDTILPDFQERKYKILNYIDTSGCTECRMKLAEWINLTRIIFNFSCSRAVRISLLLSIRSSTAFNKIAIGFFSSCSR